MKGQADGRVDVRGACAARASEATVNGGRIERGCAFGQRGDDAITSPRPDKTLGVDTDERLGFEGARIDIGRYQAPAELSQVSDLGHFSAERVDPYQSHAGPRAARRARGSLRSSRARGSFRAHKAIEARRSRGSRRACGSCRSR